MSIRLKILWIVGMILAAASVTAFVFYDAALIRVAEEDQLARARAFFQQIVITRRWVAEHGGVYVLKGPGIESNLYLLKVPNLDVNIEDTKGTTIRLIFPAVE